MKGEIDISSLPPEYEIKISHPAGLKACVVLDNLARGIGKGGIRFVENVDIEETKGLEKAMT